MSQLKDTSGEARHMRRKIVFVPFRCKACKSDERPHMAKGLCVRCYQTGMKRNWRAKKSKENETL